MAKRAWAAYEDDDNNDDDDADEGAHAMVIAAEGADKAAVGDDYAYNFFKKRPAKSVRFDADEMNADLAAREAEEERLQREREGIDSDDSEDDGDSDADRSERKRDRERNRDAKRRGLTCMLAGELKCVERHDLETRSLGQLPKEATKMEKMRRNKCKIFYLMTAALDDEVSRYVKIALECLRIDGRYPFSSTVIEASDRDIAAQMVTRLTTTATIAEKRAFLWIALFLSRQFVAVFCPRVNEGDTSTPGDIPNAQRRYTREFSANPALLGPFVAANDAPLRYIASARLVGLCTRDQFVAMATKLWMELQPWRKAKHWRYLDPRQPGPELKMLLGPGDGPDGGQRLIGYAGGPDAFEDDNE